MKVYIDGNNLISLANVRRIKLHEGRAQTDDCGVTVIYCDGEEESLWCGTKRNGGNENAVKVFNAMCEILQKEG